MIEQIERNLSQRAGLGFFIMIVIGFLALVINQPYITNLKFSFMGFFIALVLVSFFFVRYVESKGGIGIRWRLTT